MGTIGKGELPARLASWLDALDETGRWALLKLITGELRVGVSARLAKTAVASLGGHEADAVEEVWHGLEAPYPELFAWVEGRAGPPESINPAPFRPPMLSHPIEEESDFDKLEPEAFSAEWKWDGIRVQLAGGRDRDGRQVQKIYSRTGEDISGAFPDLAEAITFSGAVDGELLILREERVQSFKRAPAAPQPEGGDRQAPAGLPGSCPRLRPPGRGRGGPAAAALRRAPGAAGGLRRRAGSRPHRSLAARTLRRLGGAGRGPGRSGLRRRRAGCGRDRGRDAEAPHQPLPARPAQRAVVEVEARALPRRCGDDVRPARPREALVVLFRLHVRGLARGAGRGRGAGAGGQGLSRLHRRGTGQARPLRPQPHHQALRPGAGGGIRGGEGAGAGDRLRRRAALDPAQVGRGDAVSPRQPDPLGQAAGRGRPDRGAGAHPGPRRERGSPGREIAG